MRYGRRGRHMNLCHCAACGDGMANHSMFACLYAPAHVVIGNRPHATVKIVPAMRGQSKAKACSEAARLDAVVDDMAMVDGVASPAHGASNESAVITRPDYVIVDAGCIEVTRIDEAP